jgi:hypothetical protein
MVAKKILLFDAKFKYGPKNVSTLREAIPLSR